MRFVGVEQPSEKIGVFHLAVDDSQGVEDIKSPDLLFKHQKFVIVDDKAFKRRQLGFRTWLSLCGSTGL